LVDDLATRVTTVRQMLAGTPGGTECLVEIYGRHIGRKYDLYEEIITIGRDPDNTIVLESDSVSRRHARIERVQTDRYLVDMNSTNGTYVNDQAITPRARLATGMFVKIGDTIFKYLIGDNLEAAYYEEIHKMAVTDGLTQIANKRQLEEQLDKEVARARRHDRSLAVIMMDIDHFKQVNDVHGHLTGDVVLKEIAQLVRVRVRREELFARFGGEEFVLVLPETDREGAVEAAEAIRRLVAEHSMTFEGQMIRVTVSLGVATFDKSEHKGPDDLIRTADKNLYQAKGNGRNRVHG
jgi:diguanylate cyclase (GGDEF)-like protein